MIDAAQAKLLSTLSHIASTAVRFAQLVDFVEYMIEKQAIHHIYMIHVDVVGFAPPNHSLR
jgi:hypothetical protein